MDIVEQGKRMLRSRSMSLIFFLFAFMSTLAVAETSFQQTLFSCTFAGGENSVQVLYFPQDDGLTYAFANEQGRLELNLNDTVHTVDYTPFAWDHADSTERVTFYNGDTSYEVFSKWSGVDFIPSGGVIVTLPSGQRKALQCDERSIEPTGLLRGIGRIAVLRDNTYDAFGQCLSGDRQAVSCIGLSAIPCYTDPHDALDCRKAEQDRWEGVLAETLAETFVAAGEQQFSLDRSETVEHAQKLWRESRDFDCEISAWTNYNLFDGDLGQQTCLTDYTARRVDFLRSMQSGMKFDG